MDIVVSMAFLFILWLALTWLLDEADRTREEDPLHELDDLA